MQAERTLRKKAIDGIAIVNLDLNAGVGGGSPRTDLVTRNRR